MSKNSRLVYSTETGKLCPLCSKAYHAGKCDIPETLATGDGIVRIMRETKGRKGKGVCLITGLTLPENELNTLAKRLKQVCGSGGAIRDGIIEIQGDHREKLKAELEKLGHKVKLAGG